MMGRRVEARIPETLSTGMFGAYLRLRLGAYLRYPLISRGIYLPILIA
jgi:hypothetical protein